MSLIGPDLMALEAMPILAARPLAFYRLMMTPMLPVTVVGWQ